MPKVSVILCSHNPREDLLERVLDGLKRQALSWEAWEFLLIDNASRKPIGDWLRLDWHKHGRIVSEPCPGLTRARLTAIRESCGELLVFVDDDAVLSSDYLQRAVEIADEHPYIGVFGGNVRLEFELSPPEWSRAHWPRLAQRDVSRSIWSNFDCHSQTTPWGVGMCLRREVAIAYKSLAESDPRRQGLGRRGVSLVSGEDDDIARTSHTMGLGTGLFPQLSLTHIIPPTRLTEEYLIRLIEGQSYSGVIVDSLHGSQRSIPMLSSHRAWLGRLKRRLTMTRRQRLFFEARLRGEQRAVSELQAMDGK